ncbi:MAG: metallophosphoesterase [Caldilineaceae bacterium]|nr:metallophosphoesterase [Caldilineaceae bacterium]
MDVKTINNHTKTQILTATADAWLRRLGRHPALGRIVYGEQLAVERLALPIRGLHPALDGFRIVQLSDFHLYPYTQMGFLRQAVAQASALQPDLIVLTGDYVTLDVEAIHELAPVLATLNARHGVFSVLGNHDLWTNRRAIEAAFAQERLPLLVNQRIPITVGAGHLHVAGLDDGWSGQADLRATLDGMPADEPALLLIHEPDLFDDYAQDPRVALQLSGHSHGGQVRITGKKPRILPHLGRKYEQGLYRIGDTWLYTNRGLGYTSVPVRINCPPEITEITLTR